MNASPPLAIMAAMSLAPAALANDADLAKRVINPSVSLVGVAPWPRHRDTSARE